MSVLSVTTQRQVEKDIVDEGILTPEKMAEIRAKAKELDQPLFSVMVSEG